MPIATSEKSSARRGRPPLWNEARGAGLRPARRGSALLTVLWLTAALSAIGLAVANNVRGETERTSTGVDDARDYFIARGAIERAILHMEWRNITDPNG